MRKIVSLVVIIVIASILLGCEEKSTRFSGEAEGYTCNYIFNADGTWVSHITGTYKDESFGIEIITDLDVGAGTYKGNPKKDGNLEVTSTKMADMSSALSSLIASAFVSLLTNSAPTLRLTNEKAPLATIAENEQKTLTLTITDGKFTSREDIANNTNNLVFTRE